MSSKKAEDQNVISEVYDYLKSRGFLEQIRLECIADVKKKPTYLNLKKRVNDYLLNKWSNDDWKSETNPVEISTCREQIVECCVLAITIENVIDLVVSQKLQELMKPMLRELITNTRKSKSRGKSSQKELTFSLAKVNKAALARTMKLVKEKCDTTELETKKMLENGNFGKTLASVSFPKTSHDSDDDCFSVSVSSVRTSDLSSYNSDICLSSDEEDFKVKSTEYKAKSPSKRKGKSLSSLQQNRSQRERKLNPKYSSSLFQTSYNPKQTKATSIVRLIPEQKIKKEQQPTPDEYCNGEGKTALPRIYKTVSLTTANDTSSAGHSRAQNDKKRESKASKFIPKSCSRGDSDKATLDKSARNDKKLESKSTRISPNQSSLTDRGTFNRSTKNHNLLTVVQPKEVLTHLATFSGKDTNAVRKSERKRKLNSRIFSDSTSPYLTMMDPKNTKMDEIETDMMEFKKSRTPEPPSRCLSKTELNKSPNTSNSQRYDSSDLYKPRFIPGSRLKRT